MRGSGFGEASVVRVIQGIDELQALVGRELGVSDWLEMTQERVDLFAEATGDHQWIHVDAQRAATQSPFGGTVAHGYLTLSLIPMLAQQVYRLEGLKASVNYGLNGVRFPHPVRVGARIRGRFRIKAVEPNPRGGKVINQITIEIEGLEKPACVAETVVLVST